ncbi:MAG: hypothetical protein AMS21_13370 [Gemmatimonas sp. SG8_38_2]|nr:MAG: hypothetical protein AMS21_13370 [Gemmatimonas sp. SG8_38_2]
MSSGYVTTARIHSTGFDSVTRLARGGPANLTGLMLALWLAFSLDLIVMGLVIAAAAWRPDRLGRIVVGIAALCPFGAAGLQLRFIGFVPPTAILLAIGLLAACAAAVLPPPRAESVTC